MLMANQIQHIGFYYYHPTALSYYQDLLHIKLVFYMVEPTNITVIIIGLEETLYLLRFGGN